MHTIGNKQMNLLHLRAINDYEEELIEKKNGLVWILINGVQLANNTFVATVSKEKRGYHLKRNRWKSEFTVERWKSINNKLLLDFYWLRAFQASCTTARAGRCLLSLYVLFSHSIYKARDLIRRSYQENSPFDHILNLDVHKRKKKMKFASNCFLVYHYVVLEKQNVQTKQVYSLSLVKQELK